MYKYGAVATFDSVDAFTSVRHRHITANSASAQSSTSSTAEWLSSCRRTSTQQGNNDGFKVVHVVLALCLNVGIRPPDALQCDNVASLEAWLSPTNMSKSPDEAAELVANALQLQIESGVGRNAGRLKFKSLIDPTVDKVLRLCQQLRAKSKRPHATLFFFNGHGVPAASDNGELWCFNDDYSQYMPLSIYSLQVCLQAPAVYVFDCPNAARLIRHYLLFLEDHEREEAATAAAAAASNAGIVNLASSASLSSIPSASSVSNLASAAASSIVPPAGDPPEQQQQSTQRLSQRLRDRTVLLAACGAEQRLPTNPALPADFFTACLTAPLKTMLYVTNHVASTRVLTSASYSHRYVSPASCDVPGDLSDKATPLGFLDWLLTSVCDAMAYEVVPLLRFQLLFREDITLAGLCRNFLVAQRLMCRYHVLPVSYPPLPDLSHHPLWLAFDTALEQVVLQLPPPAASVAAIVLNGTLPPSMQSPQAALAQFLPPVFFEEQLCAAEIALATSPPRPVPLTMLPIVLQALLGAAHRGRALNWLARYIAFDTASAAAHCLAIDALPYVAGLLRTRRPNLRRALLVVWSHLLSVDIRSTHDLCAAAHGIAFMLDAFSAAAPAAEATAAAYVLAIVAHEREHALAAQKLIADAVQLMRSLISPSLRIWSALLVGELAAGGHVVPPSVHRCLLELLHSDECPDARAAAAYALSGVLASAAPDDAVSLVVALSAVARDASALVRAEVLYTLSRFVPNAAAGAAELAASVRACLISVFELLESDAFTQIARDAAAAKRALTAPGGSGTLARSTFFTFARVHACGTDWVGGVSAQLLEQLTDDAGNPVGTVAPTPSLAEPDPTSKAGESAEYWCSVHPVGVRVADPRAQHHIARLHAATPVQLYHIRKQTQLEQFVAEWQRREMRGERYVLESQLKALKKSRANNAPPAVTAQPDGRVVGDANAAGGGGGGKEASPDDDEGVAASFAQSFLRHPPVRFDHDVCSVTLGKGVAPRALVIDSIRGECAFAGSDGTVGLWQLASSQTTPGSRFRVSRTAENPRRHVASALALLNRRSSNPLMLTASLGDECVRVWRDYGSSDAAQMCAAWSLDLGGLVVAPSAPAAVAAAAPSAFASLASAPASAAAAFALASRVSSPIVARTRSPQLAGREALTFSSDSAVSVASAQREAATSDSLMVAWRQRSMRLAVARGHRVLLFDALSEREVWHVDAVVVNTLTALHADYLCQCLVVGDSDGVSLMLDTRLRPEEAVVARLDRPRATPVTIQRHGSLAALWRHSSDMSVRRESSEGAERERDESAEAGHVLEIGMPTLRPTSLVVAHSSGAVRVWDVRATANAPVVYGGVRGGASCASVHKRLPLVALGSLNQRLWLYSTDGFVMHELRNHRFGSTRIGSVTHLQLDHFRPHIIAGCADGTLSLHADEATPFSNEAHA